MRKLIIILTIIAHCNSYGMTKKLDWDKAIDNAITHYGLHTEPALKKLFNQEHVAYPPQEVALLAFKQERYIELWAKNYQTSWRYINKYPLTAFSGKLGPKLRVGDRQIPEGIYHLTSFNPYSNMHLSMMINYPNQLDHLHAIQDGRKNLGGDIFIHGKSISVGCLAIGNYAIDQIFMLARRVGLKHMQIIIAPNDLRKKPPATIQFTQPRWLPELYKQISIQLKQFPVTNNNLMYAAK